jgi:hypothetical protein
MGCDPKATAPRVQANIAVFAGQANPRFISPAMNVMV